MSFGRPVVATSVGGIPELVEEAVTGFLAPRGDSAATADGILRLLANSALCTRLERPSRR